MWISRSLIRFLARIIDSSGLHADPQKTTAPFKCLRDTAIHGNGQPPWKIYSQPGWPQWPPSSIITQRQCLGLGWTQAKSLRAAQASVSVTESPGTLQSKPLNDHLSGCFQQRSCCGIISSSGWCGERRSVCYASRSLSDTEKRYAVIEKEALATKWASERFSNYVLVIPFTLETDHKPLTALLNSSDLSKMPARILRFCVWLMRYSYKVQYVTGRHQVTADKLSRAPAGLPKIEDELLVEEVEVFSIQTISCLAAMPNRLQQISRLRILPLKIVLFSRRAPLIASPAVTTPILGKQNPPHDCRWLTPVHFRMVAGTLHTNRWVDQGGFCQTWHPWCHYVRQRATV